MKTLFVLIVVAVISGTRSRIYNSAHYQSFSSTGKVSSALREGSWGYEEENGPDTWADSFPTCGGIRQSPVALNNSEAIKNPFLKSFDFDDYDVVPTLVMLTNTGHSAEVDMNIHASVSGGGLPDEYIFHQFHIHWGSTNFFGSEHTIDSKRFPAELHLVHFRRSYGSWEEALKHHDGVAVLGIMLKLSYINNPHLQSIVNGLNKVTKPHETAFINTFALRNILPNNIDKYFRYRGSLTTPPCNEVVIWTVFKDTIPISIYQLSQFRRLTVEGGSTLQDNFRTLQPLNGRKVYSSQWPYAPTRPQQF